MKLACALASFDQVPGTDSSGNFQATGVYRKLSGPVQAGDPRKYAATYSGQVNGDSLQLTVAYVDASGTPQSDQLTLIYGDSHQIFEACPL